MSEVPESHTPRHDRAWLAIGVFVVMVILAAMEILPISIGSFVAGGFLIATPLHQRTRRPERAYRYTSWS